MLPITPPRFLENWMVKVSISRPPPECHDTVYWTHDGLACPIFFYADTIDRPMGLGDKKHVFAAWFADDVAPTAFFHTLPDNFVASLVLRDMSALLHGAFQSKASTTGTTLAERAGIDISGFAQSPVTPRSGLSLVARLETSDGCTSRQRQEHPSSLPDPDALVANLTDYRAYVCALTDDAHLVLSKDDSRFTPSIRSLIHAKRSLNKAPLDDGEMTRERYVVLGDHCLPGVSPLDNKPLPTFNELRQRAYAMSCFRRAVSSYVPWHMVQTIVGAHRCPHCTHFRSTWGATAQRHLNVVQVTANLTTRAVRLEREADRAALPAGRTYMIAKADAARQEVRERLVALDTDKPEDEPECTCSHQIMANTSGTHRHVVIDHADPAFDLLTYAAHSVEQVPAKVYRRRPLCVADISLATRRVRFTGAPAIGESDLKMVQHILQYSSPGDDVLVCNIDSDVLFILLLNMRLLGTRRVFIDVGLPTMSKDRIYRRFVCINTLYAGFVAHANRYWSMPIEWNADVAVAVFSAAAVLCGSDYTSSIRRGIGPAKIINVISNANFMRTLIAAHPPFLVAGDDDGPVRCFVAQPGFVERFSLAVICNSFSVKIRGHLLATQSSVERESWVCVAKVLSAFGKTLPLLADILAKWQRISWTLTYMASASSGRGVFPSPLAAFDDGADADADAATSVWGWTTNAAGAEVPTSRVHADTMLVSMFAMTEWEVRGTLGWRMF